MKARRFSALTGSMLCLAAMASAPAHAGPNAPAASCVAQGRMEFDRPVTSLNGTYGRFYLSDEAATCAIADTTVTGHLYWTGVLRTQLCHSLGGFDEGSLDVRVDYPDPDVPGSTITYAANDVDAQFAGGAAPLSLSQDAWPVGVGGIRVSNHAENGSTDPTYSTCATHDALGPSFYTSSLDAKLVLHFYPGAVSTPPTSPLPDSYPSPASAR